MASFRNLSKYSPTVGRCIANNLKDSQTRNVSRCLTCVSNQLNRTASLNDVSLVGTAAVGGGRNRLLREQRAELHLPTSLNPFKGNKRKEYSERRLLGYTMEQMYRVAADVDSYTEFVPWCKQAYTTDHTRGRCKAHMTIGFPPLSENYIANVTTERPNLVKSICKDGRMFDLLATTWKFSPGLAHIPQTCTLDFSVSGV
ncbi:coenzyme Q-binding protein COQ10 homolog B, mitochondrial-like isoform X2 [Tubulanus polymorphus]|uniref:coenzyme Q-binding protein COQ10 homolog B, mitochondrial-like isoform X2 n=1 Tax=Tubulanus polymorphus TaxID=672921 RepID=UPI003DA6C8E6